MPQRNPMGPPGKVRIEKKEFKVHGSRFKVREVRNIHAKLRKDFLIREDASINFELETVNFEP